MKNIFITRKIPDVGIKMLTDKGYVVDVYPEDRVPTQAELIEYLSKKPYDAVICLLTDEIDAKIYDAVPTAKLIATYTVGFNNIDVVEAKKRGIMVSNTAGASRVPVAEQAIALMLGLTTRLVEADQYTRDGKYEGWSPMHFMGEDFSGKTLGLVGTGAIGGEVARMAHMGFGVKIIYSDPRPNEQIEKDYGATRMELEDVLKNADLISIHVPLMDSTHHLINADRLKLMKPTAFLVNTSRGPVIDEAALVEALKNKTIAGAGLDVYEFEPKLSPGLADLQNAILTPHIASARVEARDEMAEIVANNVIDFFEGRTPRNEVKM